MDKNPNLKHQIRNQNHPNHSKSSSFIKDGGVIMSKSFDFSKRKADSLTQNEENVHATSEIAFQIDNDLQTNKQHDIQKRRRLSVHEDHSSFASNQPLSQNNKSKSSSNLQRDIQKSHESSTKTSRFRRFLRKKILKKRFCEICEIEINTSKELWIADCQHKNNFCEKCLVSFVQEKFGRFEEVTCAAQNCGCALDVNGLFFIGLGENMKRKYNKIAQYYVTLRDESLRLCPKEKCDGMIRIIDQMAAICSSCLTEYCKKCFFQIHKGTCQDFQMNYFYYSLELKQCRKCKAIIEKNKGCNHITCKCQYQFCYLCGEQWSENHRCDNWDQEFPHFQRFPLDEARIQISISEDRSSQLPYRIPQLPSLRPSIVNIPSRAIPNQVNQGVPAPASAPVPSSAVKFLKILLKTILFMLYCILVAICSLLTLLGVVIYFVVMILFGATVGITLYFLKKQCHLVIVILLTLMQPIFWPIGIYFAIRNYFWEGLTNTIIKMYCKAILKLYEGICDL